MKFEDRIAIIAFTLLVLGNLIIITLFATGRYPPSDVIRLFWVFVCDGGVAIMLTWNEIVKPRVIENA